MSPQNLYIPYLMKIEKITREAPGVKHSDLSSSILKKLISSGSCRSVGEYSVLVEGESLSA